MKACDSSKAVRNDVSPGPQKCRCSAHVAAHLVVDLAVGSDVGHLEHLLDLALVHALAELRQDVLDLADGNVPAVLLVKHLERLEELGYEGRDEAEQGKRRDCELRERKIVRRSRRQ